MSIKTLALASAVAFSGTFAFAQSTSSGAGKTTQAPMNGKTTTDGTTGPTMMNGSTTTGISSGGARNVSSAKKAGTSAGDEGKK